MPNNPIDGTPIEPPTVSVCDSTATSARQHPAAAIVVAALVPNSCDRVRRVMRRWRRSARRRRSSGSQTGGSW